MSRSQWACVEGCRRVSVAACGADERTRLEDRACLGRGPLAGAVSSTTRLIVGLIAASMLVMAAAPASALAGSTSGLHPTTSINHTDQPSVHVAHAGAVVLAPGSGYSSRPATVRVRALQRRLTRAGYPPGPIDGRYGPRTQQAVTRFQAAHGLAVDGIAGPQTVARLASERKPQKTARPSRPKNSRQRASRHAHGGRSHRRAHTAPRKVVSPTRSTSSPSLALVVWLVALVAVGLCSTWLAYRRHNKQYAEAQTKRANGPDPADATPTKANHTAIPNQITTVPSRDLTSAEDAERAFNDAVLLEEQGDLAAAAASYSRADQLGHGAAACNLGVLLHEQGDWAAAEACFQRADQRGDPHGAFNLAVVLEEHGDQIAALSAYERAAQLGDPETAEKVRAAADDLGRRVERPTAARKGGGPDDS
jgi:peptidoglycan hydrolase-like protein with peptidoglycan-binding domain